MGRRHSFPTSQRFAAIVLATALLLAACSRTATPTMAPPTAGPMDTAVVPVPTQAETSPTLPPATATAVPAANTPTVPISPPPPEPQVKRIEFAPGATWAIVQGSLAAGGIDEYLVRALAGQSMMVIVKSPDNSVVLEIYGVSDGQPLVRSSMQQTSWQVILLATQDYSIKAVSMGGATTYSLQVIIPPLETPPPPQAKRIEFAAGATSAVVQGTLAAEGIDEYLLRALGGQSMTVTVWSPDSSVVLEIYGISDGQPLLRSQMRQTSFQGTLPATQDYSIKAVATGAATSYTLQVIIPAGSAPTPLPQTRRIQFAADATSAVVQGTLAARGIDEYLVGAQAGQWMMVMVSSPDGNVVLEIWGTSDGQVLARADMRQTFWQGFLPATQDYGVKAVSTAGASNYTLQVIIPERVQFAPGAISATGQGNLAPRETHEYLLRALKGQTMTVTIVSPGNLVLVEIYGIDDGQPLVRVPFGQTTWTGVLPNTQDYDIKAVSVTDLATLYSIAFTVQ
jgi:hypothetical protein